MESIINTKAPVTHSGPGQDNTMKWINKVVNFIIVFDIMLMGFICIGCICFGPLWHKILFGTILLTLTVTFLRNPFKRLLHKFRNHKIKENGTDYFILDRYDPDL